MIRVEEPRMNAKLIPFLVTLTSADQVAPRHRSAMPSQFVIRLFASSISPALNWSSDVCVSWGR